MKTIWIFGYGSLIWRPDFPYVHCRRARLVGWCRRFWQGSVDHRGVPGRPGRVLTLVPDQDSVCFGKAFRINPEDREWILEKLDHREKGGYQLVTIKLDFCENGTECVEGLTYVAKPENPQWLGEASLEEIALQIKTSRGPSGSNQAYLMTLQSSLLDLDIRDPHISMLAEMVASI